MFSEKSSQAENNVKKLSLAQRHDFTYRCLDTNPIHQFEITYIYEIQPWMLKNAPSRSLPHPTTDGFE
jgi:hypothetical protein